MVPKLRPPLLDMKWGNHDINFVERSKIPKFSKLDDIRTPPTLGESFFNYALGDMVFGYIKLYGHKEKEEINFETTKETFRLVLDMLLLSGCHKLPDHKMRWETFVQEMSDSIPRAKFERILQSLNLCDNEELDKTNSQSSSP